MSNGKVDEVICPFFSEFFFCFCFVLHINNNRKIKQHIMAGNNNKQKKLIAYL